MKITDSANFDDSGKLRQAFLEIDDACSQYVARVSALAQTWQDEDFEDLARACASIKSRAQELSLKSENVEKTLAQKQDLLRMYESIRLK